MVDQMTDQMAFQNTQLLVFAKHWPELSLQALGRMVKGLGFDGVELPVRPGFPVTPETAAQKLPEAVRILAEQGIRVASVAADASDKIIEACGHAGVPLIRVMAPIDMSKGYLASESKARKELDALLPALKEHGVAVGVQNHCGMFIGSAVGIMHFIEDYDPKCVGAVLDLGHSGLVGEPDEMAIDIVWSHLLLVNLKSAYWRRSAGPEVKDAPWKPYWTIGGYGLCTWRTVIEELRRRRYGGDICLTAEYSSPDGDGHLDGDAVGGRAEQDLDYVRSLLKGG
jgi:sugar phosphate isomerase/epimerase